MCHLTKLVWTVIPTWNRREDLLECLDSLLSVEYSPFRILVVDNASDDGSVEAVNEYYPEIQVICLNKNVGAPAASNIGFKFALSNDAEFVLRLDSDTIVAPDFLTPLVNCILENPLIGVVSPKIFFHNPSEKVWYEGANANSFHYGAIESQHKHDKPDEVSRIRTVDYVWGAAMLISKDVLLKTEGFDTDFFIYYEEVDFCKRVQALGYSLAYVPDSFVWHKVGSEKHNSWTAYHWNKSKMLLFRKHAKNDFHKLCLIIYAFCYAFVSPIYKGNLSGNRGPLKNTLIGLCDGLKQSL
jgi:GT2 family glycosyltransferase